MKSVECAQKKTLNIFLSEGARAPQLEINFHGSGDGGSQNDPLRLGLCHFVQSGWISMASKLAIFNRRFRHEIDTKNEK